MNVRRVGLFVGLGLALGCVSLAPAQKEPNKLEWKAVGPIFAGLTKVVETTKPIGDYAPDEEQKFVVAYMVLENRSDDPVHLSGQELLGQASDKDGKYTYDFLGELLQQNKPDPIDGILKPHNRLAVRLVFRALKDAVRPNSLRLTWVKPKSFTDYSIPAK